MLLELSFRTPVVAAALLLAGPLLHADDQKSSNSGSFTQVPVQSGGQTTYIKVQKQPTPSNHASWASSPDKYNPETYDLGRTSSMANKSFASGANTSVSKNKSSFQKEAFLTKSYSIGNQSDQTTPNLTAKVPTYSATAYGKNASSFDKGFAGTSAEMTQNKKVLFASNTSELQGRTATIGSQQINTSAPFAQADKSYQGPEVSYIRRDLNDVNSGLSRMSDLPNRALTIDEVRNLINHDAKPSPNAKPEPASKPMNDPDYKPQSLRATPAPTEDKDDLIPSPGVTAAGFQPPENSEPLPK